ncbi:alpha/beta hydrolase [Streptomyces sp. NPDC006872]|uniref:alpha/beta hydrolase n=1 Tax=Streptomyces sp. NPDC006872 TaxID=3155720 RepID=UPI0033D84A46
MAERRFRGRWGGEGVTPRALRFRGRWGTERGTLRALRFGGRWRSEGGTPRARRWFRALLAVLITAAVVGPLTAAAASPQIPAPAPADLAPVTAATLEKAYAANRANAALAARMAAAHGDRHRAAADEGFASPSRTLLAFDGRGQGRATEVFGDLAHADRVAILIPGSDTSLDTYARFRAGAAALYERLEGESGAPGESGTGRESGMGRASGPGRESGTGQEAGTGRTSGARTAVVAWLGYTTPGTVSATVITPARADEAAPELREFLRGLRTLTGPDTHVSLLCHSYGTVVCGRAAPGLDVSDLVLLGSPGTGVDTVAGLRTRARVWAARGADDWVADVPHVSVDLFGTTVGLGADPMSASFGAHVFAAGAGGHSDYFRPGSAALANIARIVLGETSEVTDA